MAWPFQSMLRTHFLASLSAQLHEAVHLLLLARAQRAAKKVVDVQVPRLQLWIRHHHRDRSEKMTIMARSRAEKRGEEPCTAV